MKFFLGVTKFSIQNSGSGEWLMSHKLSDKDYEKILFNDARLDQRSKIFFEYSLPILYKANKKFKLIHVVLYTADLPEKYKNLIKEAVDKYDFLECILINPRQSNDLSIYTNIIKKHLNFNEPREILCGYYNLDDDDLLSVEYFEKIYRYLDANNIFFYISLGLGFTCVLSNANKKLTNFRSCYLPKINIGLMKICNFNSVSGLVLPPYGPHMTIDKSSPLITDSRVPSWIWIRSAFQDTNVYSVQADKEVSLMRPIHDYLDTHCVEHILDLDNVLKFFPSLDGAIDNISHANIEIPDDGILTNEGINLKFPKDLSATGNYSIRYRIDSPPGTNINAALITPLSDLGSNGLDSFSLAKDLSRYLVTNRGNYVGTISYEMPNNFGLVGFNVRLWSGNSLIRLKEFELIKQ